MSSFPSDLRYTHDHEWLRAQGTTWRVGITQFAVDQLGDITLVDPPKEGDLVTKGQRFGTVESVKSVSDLYAAEAVVADGERNDVESVKSVSDLYAPVSGKVIAVNAALKDSPELVNGEPYGNGWMIDVEPTEKAEIDELMTADAYTKHVVAQ
jgi:glycine cleavage system H protein